MKSARERQRQINRKRRWLRRMWPGVYNNVDICWDNMGIIDRRYHRAAASVAANR